MEISNQKCRKLALEELSDILAPISFLQSTGDSETLETLRRKAEELKEGINGLEETFWKTSEYGQIVDSLIKAKEHLRWLCRRARDARRGSYAG